MVNPVMVNQGLYESHIYEPQPTNLERQMDSYVLEEQNQSAEPYLLNHSRNNSRNMYGNPNYSREVQFSMYPRDVRSPMNNFISKMSPQQNFTDEGTGDEKYYEGDNIRLRNMNQEDYPEAEQEEVVLDSGKMPREIRQNLETNDECLRISTEMQDEKDIKKLMRGMRPNKMKSGGRNEVLLINESQTVVPSMQNYVLKDRYQVLQKMGKLSSILLAKKRNEGKEVREPYSKERKNVFNRNTLNNSVRRSKEKDMTLRSPRNKFLYLSLAMLSSKGPNCEDRIILPKMRLEKGGVVDLAQEERKGNKYNIKKGIKKTIGKRSSSYSKYNPKYRDTAARVIQGWWKSLREKYNRILDKIILIQSIWRGRWLRKYIYEIIYISFLNQRFCDIITKVLKEKVRPDVWNKLFSKRNYIKRKLTQLFEKFDPICRQISFKSYFDHWADLIKKGKKLAGNLVNIKQGQENDLDKLNNAFQLWLVKANLANAKDDIKFKDFKMKEIALQQIADKLKKNNLRSVKPKFDDYKKRKSWEKILSSLLRRLPENYRKKVLKNFFDKWKSKSISLQINDLKDSIFKSMLSHISNRIDNERLRNKFNKWRMTNPKDSLLKRIQGLEKLENYVDRRTYPDVLKCFKRKVVNEGKEADLKKLMKNKLRGNKGLLKDYLNKWKNKANQLMNKELQNQMFVNLLNTMLNKIKNRILSNKFNQWKKEPKVDPEELLNRYKNMNDFIFDTVNKCIQPDKEEFLLRCKKRKAPEKVTNASKKLLRLYNNKNEIPCMKYYLYKWREQIKNGQLKDLRNELFKYICSLSDATNKNKALSRAFKIWFYVSQADKNKKDLQNLSKIAKGASKLEKLRANRINDAFNKIYRERFKDLRPTLLKLLTDKLDKPRESLKSCLLKWRNANQQGNNNDNINLFRSKLLGNFIRNLNTRFNRENLAKIFNNWRLKSKKVEESCPKIIQGSDRLRSALKKKYLEEPFEKIKTSKNYDKYLTPLLNIKDKSEDRKNKVILRKAFLKWKFLKDNFLVNQLVADLVFRLKVNSYLNAKNGLLSKYLNKWRIIKDIPKPKFTEKTLKAVELLENYTWRKNLGNVLGSMNNKNKNSNKLRAAKMIHKKANELDSKARLKAIGQFFLKAGFIDPNRKEKAKTILKRLVNRYSKPALQRYFDKLRFTSKDLPEYKNIVEGSDLLKSGLIKLFSNEFYKINDYTCPLYQDKILTKLFRKYQQTEDGAFKTAFNQWRNTASKLGNRNLKAEFLAKLYEKNKNSFIERIYRQKFAQWRFNRKDIKAEDIQAYITNVRKLCDKLKNIFANKYLSNIFDDLNEIAKINMLKKLINNYKYYLPSTLRAYNSKWRAINNEEKKKELLGTIIKNLRSKNDTKSNIVSLAKAFNNWKNKIRDIHSKRDHNIEEAIELLRMANLEMNGTYFISILKQLLLDPKTRKDYDEKLEKILVIFRRKDNDRLRRNLNKWRIIKNKLIYTDLSLLMSLSLTTINNLNS